MDTNHKRYMKEFGSSMAAYTVIVFVSVWLLKHRVHSPLRFLVAVLPVVPSAFAMWAAIRYFRGLDELQRRIQFEGPGLQLSGHLPDRAELGIPAERGPAARRRDLGGAAAGLSLGSRLLRRQAEVPVKNSVRDLRAQLELDAGRSRRKTRRLAPDGQRHRDGKIRSQPAAGFQDREDLPQAGRGDFQELVARAEKVERRVRHNRTARRQSEESVRTPANSNSDYFGYHSSNRTSIPVPSNPF